MTIPQFTIGIVNYKSSVYIETQLKIYKYFAGENVERRTEKQIIITSDSTCKHDCEIELHDCILDCDNHQNAWCKSDCQTDYRKCIDKCDE